MRVTRVASYARSRLLFNVWPFISFHSHPLASRHGRLVGKAIRESNKRKHLAREASAAVVLMLVLVVVASLVASHARNSALSLAYRAPWSLLLVFSKYSLVR